MTGKTPSDESATSVSFEAMATLFHVRTAGCGEVDTRQAAAEVEHEIARLEQLLSRYVQGSDIDRFNRAPPGEWVRFSAVSFECVGLALEMARVTQGAFNPAIGRLTGDPLEREHPSTADPSPFGFLEVELDPSRLQLRKHREDLRLDLGGIGKGFALDVARERLSDWELPAVLLDAGGSTLLMWDNRSEPGCWHARIEGQNGPLEVPLQRHAIAGSSMHVKGAHIVDGRDGNQVRREGRVWATAPTAAVADALSTAFFVMAWNDAVEICAKHPEFGAAIHTQPTRGPGSGEFHATGYLARLLAV